MAEYAEKFAKGMGKKLEDIPRIKGWGHNTARLRFADKVAESANDDSSDDDRSDDEGADDDGGTDDDAPGDDGKGDPTGA